MKDAERVERLEEVLGKLKEMCRDRIIFVEGKEDTKALNTLGIYGDMFEVQASGGPVRAAEYAESNGKSSVILTDWDRRGDSLAKQLVSLLPPGTADMKIRSELAHLCGAFISDVESLDVFIEMLSVRADIRHRV